MSYETDFDAIYGGSYINAASVKEGPLRYVVDRIEDKSDIRDKNGGAKRALVIHFAGCTKALVLNKTNANILAGELGTKYPQWNGAVLELYEVDTNTGAGVRIKVIRKPGAGATPSADAAPTPTPASSPRGGNGFHSDDIPF